MLLVLLLHLTLILPRPEIGLASRYGIPGTGTDRWSARTLRCHRYMSPEHFARAAAQGCAHRTLPCGTRLLVWDLRTGQSTTCTVVDRGPYGAFLDRSYESRKARHRPGSVKLWVVKRRAQDPGRWIGILDLLDGPARQLRLSGKHPVLILPMP